MKIHRETFLSVLESVAPGLSPRADVIEQSSCFAFKEGKVFSFNEELACRRESGLDDSFIGAVKADKLLDQLRQWPDDEVDVSVAGNNLVIKAGRRKAGFTMESEFNLPVDQVEEPGEWVALPADFSEAIALVQRCASSDPQKPMMAYIHIHSKWIEACDDFQMCRWMMRTKLSQPTLVKRDCVKHLTGLGMNEWSETEGWLHFRNPSGLVMSCRRYLEDYIDLSGQLEPGGERVILPKGLSEACDKASVFSSENTEFDSVLIELTPGKLKIRGEGASGWYTESKKIDYKGAALSFQANPEMLSELVKKHSECMVSEGRLLVDSGKFQYALRLFVADEPTTPDTNGEEQPRRRKARVETNQEE